MEAGRQQMGGWRHVGKANRLLEAGRQAKRLMESGRRANGWIGHSRVVGRRGEYVGYGSLGEGGKVGKRCGTDGRRE